MNDTALVTASQAGDLEAFKTLFEQHRRTVLGIAYNYVKNLEDAEDILQETFIKAYHSLHQFKAQDQNRFSSWLYRIGVNCSIDLIRRQKRKNEKVSAMKDLYQGFTHRDPSDPEHRRQMKEIRQEVDQAMTKLSPRQRMIFQLKHEQQFSIKEIAALMECSEGSIKKQLFRSVGVIKAGLRRFLGEGRYEM